MPGTFLQVVKDKLMKREEIRCGSGEKIIQGSVYIPEGEGPFPLVIISHGLGGSHLETAPYARRLADCGYAACVFDFWGGTAGNGKSGGRTTEMSVLTEADDLAAVLSGSEHWTFADQSRVYLMGESQGAVVSLLSAAGQPSRFAGLIFLYPAFSLVEEAHHQFGAKEYIPREFAVFHGWIHLGRKYILDLWDLDMEAAMAAFSGPVLLLHGDKDEVIGISGSEKAAGKFSDCEFYKLTGAGHGFPGAYFEKAMARILSFLEKQ